jgi:Tol biopolymer transport system component
MVWWPAASSATVAFNTSSYSPEVWVSPNEDGSEARHVGNGWVAQVSPDGKLVAFEHAEAFTGWELKIYDVATGKVHVRLIHMRTTSDQIVGEETAFAWSPDSTKVAALQSEPRSGKQTLYVIGVGRPPSHGAAATADRRLTSRRGARFGLEQPTPKVAPERSLPRSRMTLI